MLNSNIDRNIKRLLSILGTREHNSLLYNSVYYLITYPSSEKILVRFSDHFSDRGTLHHLNIVKTSVGFYTIKDDYTGVCITLSSENIVTYLKRYLTVLPEVCKVTQSFRNVALKAERDLITIKGKLAKLQKKYSEYEDIFNEIDQTMARNKEVSTRIKQVENSNNQLRASNTALKEENESLRKELLKYKNLIKQVKSMI